MRAIAALVATGARTVGYLLGSFALVLAGAMLISRTTIEEAAQWSFQVNGITFTALLIALIFAAIYCWLNLRGRSRDDPGGQKWLEAGIQAANGITTLALTFTLLGVSLGLSSLAAQRLTPETIPEVIHGLTGTFALAFLTTVVGQPIAAVLRTVLMVTHAINQERADAPAPVETVPTSDGPVEPILPPLAEPAKAAPALVKTPEPPAAKAEPDEPPQPAPQPAPKSAPAAAAAEARPPAPEPPAPSSATPPATPNAEATEPLPPRAPSPEPAPPSARPPTPSAPITIYAGERA